MPNVSEEKAVSQNGLLYFWQALKTKLGSKVDKVDGMGLSANDYTTTEKNKLSGIATGATKNTVENVLTSDSTTNALSAAQGKALDGKIKELSDSMSDLGYGDMMKATYDANNDGIVDDASKLGGKAPNAYGLADGTNIKTAFTAAATRVNIATGEALTVIFGKIAKYFSDLKTVAFTGKFSDLVDAPSIPTVTNDLTNTLKTNYDAAYTHSTTAHAPAVAQENVIESVKVNGTAQPITSKSINISVPTTVASLTDAGNYALKSDLTNVYKYKGTKPTFADLPSSGNKSGDVWDVAADGMNYAWNGSAWDPLGSIFTIQYITNAEIDAILAS